ncbi:ABC transporter permease [Alloacidobacterium dinghuense]|uniref:ABC transporter permease n=1 Tax=Alloacidobacterium dinghuense TaxID=2763107 RepID=A0A7G8BPK3_9BACT|nr:ABC transporter permease [Alloacidobacterium dinghuense]QNI34473.1 ABC transporter permease [Alloacidobacterium dinghuense]
MFKSLVTGLRALFRRERRNADIQSELDCFLQASIDDKLRRGLSSDQAVSAARAEIGSAETVRIKVWSAGWESAADALLQDLRFAVRQLRKNPGFAATAILVLTLGIGAAVTIFSFVDAALIQPLPYAQPSRLAIVYESNTLGPHFHLSYLDWLDYQRRNTVFTSLEAFANYGFMLATPDGPQPVHGTRVTAGFFRTLGVSPVLGRDFRPDDDQPAAPFVALISYSAWLHRFGGGRNIIGQTVTLSGNVTSIIGVLPPSFHFAPAEPSEFWGTERPDGGCEKVRGCHNLIGLARLRPGVGFAAALADAQRIGLQLAQQYPGDDHGRGATMDPLVDAILGSIRPLLLMLLAGAALLLLIAAINVSSLLLVRTERRRREMAVRGALGASSSRLVSQFLTEGIALAVFAGALGLGFAFLLIRLVLGLIPKDFLDTMPYVRAVGLNAHVLAFTALVTLIAAIIFSLLPALRVSHADLRDGLQEVSRGASGTVWRRFGSNLVIAELAIAMILLVGAGLLGKSFYRLLHVDTGLNADGLATLDVSGTIKTGTEPEWISFERRIHAELGALPGVASVSITEQAPLGDGDGSSNFVIVGRPPVDHNEVIIRDVSAGYFSTLQARLVRGRFFADDEDQSRQRVVVINQQLAKLYFPGEDPVGQQIAMEDGDQKSPMLVIGVVDTIQEGQPDAAPQAAMYRPRNQNPSPPNDGFTVVLRTGQSESSVLSEAASAIHAANPTLAVSDPGTMLQKLYDSPSATLHRASAWMVGSFAALALLLSVVGLYGVVAYSVSLRTREIGVRMALGAQRSTVYRMILREAGGLAMVGIVLGLAGSLAATTLLGKLLFQVRAWDVTTLAAVSIVLAIAALVASFLPARRAASVDPTEALHAE